MLAAAEGLGSMARGFSVAARVVSDGASHAAKQRAEGVQALVHRRPMDKTLDVVEDCHKNPGEKHNGAHIDHLRGFEA